MPRSLRTGVNANRPDAVDEFFRTVFPRAVAVAQRVTGDRAAAEDAAIEALAKAHARWNRVGALERADLWVMKVAVNEAISRLPRRPPVSPERPLSDLADAVALRQTLVAALGALPKRQCEVVVLRYLVGLPEPEVASALHISLGTVKTHLRRGLRQLRSLIGHDIEEGHLARLV